MKGKSRVLEFSKIQTYGNFIYAVTRKSNSQEIGTILHETAFGHYYFCPAPNIVFKMGELQEIVNFLKSLEGGNNGR